MIYRGKKFSVTCSTSIAASQFKNGQTIHMHRWSVYGDGSILEKELLSLINNDEKYAKTKERIQKCDIFIIDECFVISKPLL